MILIDKIKPVLPEIRAISIGYSELVLFGAESLEAGQIGYSLDVHGNSLVGDKEDAWKASWIVIGYDGLVGDPIFVDASDDNFPVFTASHGQGEWKAILIANTLQNFNKILAHIKVLSTNRQSPDEIEKNPIPNVEMEHFLCLITNENVGLNISYWQQFLEQLD